MVTVFGSSGFIGTHLVQRLNELAYEVFCPGRNEVPTGRHLGDVIYCIGLTADFRGRQMETVDAHAAKFLDVVRECHYDSITYLSSTRIYDGSLSEAREDTSIVVNSLDPDHLYNISKLMGESICINCVERGRVVRLSNVYGEDFQSENFLNDIMRDAVETGMIVLRSSLESAKDYVSIRDVTDMLIRIALEGRQKIYNVASGENVSNCALVEQLRALTGCEVEVVENASTRVAPRISIDRIMEDFGYKPSRIVDDLPALVQSYRRHVGEKA